LASSIEFNYKLLNFNEMKKQILFMMFLSLAFVFAGLKSYGQVDYIKYIEATDVGDIECTQAIPLTCTTDDDPLHPLPGKDYTYTITTSPEAVASVLWFVTDDPNVIIPVSGVPTLTTDRDFVDGEYVLSATTGVY